jgi:hypothetical protein
VWSLPNILGLVLGLVGALGVVQLRPQMSVSPQEETEKGQPFSAPFRFENTGHFSFNVTDVYCYIKGVKAANYRMTGPSGDLIHRGEWTNINLESGDGGTIPCIGPRAPEIQMADITIVIDYKPFRFFPFSFRKYFCFTGFKGLHVDNWQWTRSPSGKIEAEVDAEIIRPRPRIAR